MSIPTLAMVARAMAMCRAAPKSDSISVTAARTLMWSSSPTIAGMAMAERTEMTPITIVTSIALKPRRTVATFHVDDSPDSIRQMQATSLIRLMRIYPFRFDAA